MAADGEREVRRIGLSVDAKAPERAAEFAVRREHARDAREDAEIGAREREGAVDRRRARILGLPGTEDALRRDLAWRAPVGQRRVERHRAIEPDEIGRASRGG